MDTDAFEERLTRRQARFGLYLRARGVLGLVLAAAAAALGVVAVAIAVGAEWAEGLPGLPRWAWDRGAGTFVTVAILLTVVFFLGRAGIAFWRHRHLEDDDTGCLVG